MLPLTGFRTFWEELDRGTSTRQGLNILFPYFAFFFHIFFCFPKTFLGVPHYWGFPRLLLWYEGISLCTCFFKVTLEVSQVTMFFGCQAPPLFALALKFKLLFQGKPCSVFIPKCRFAPRKGCKQTSGPGVWAFFLFCSESTKDFSSPAKFPTLYRFFVCHWKVPPTCWDENPWEFEVIFHTR